MSSVSVARRDELPLIVIAYASFFVLGFPGAILGVLTPAIRDSFVVSLDTIGQYFLAFSIGYIVASSLTGRLIAHFNTGLLLIASCLLTTAALAGIALSSSWTVFFVFSIMLGATSAVQDAGMNIVFAARFNARLMNWLHASFGLGAMTAPLLATTLLQSNMDWRVGYWVIAGLYLAVVVAFIFTRDRWEIPHSSETAQTVRDVSLTQTLRLPFVWMGIALFMLLAGIEAGIGQWSPSLLTEGRGIDAVTAGYWTTAYWASFTVGRIFFGAVDLKLSAQALVRAVALACLGGMLLLWWSPAGILDLVALLVIGFSIAPMFATLITHTQNTLGDNHGSNAIGIQMAAASLGIGTIPWLAGVAAASLGLNIVPPFFLVAAVLLLVLVLFLDRVGIAKVKSG
jgi:fucose permease